MNWRKRKPGSYRAIDDRGIVVAEVFRTGSRFRGLGWAWRYGLESGYAGTMGDAQWAVESRHDAEVTR